MNVPVTVPLALGTNEMNKIGVCDVESGEREPAALRATDEMDGRPDGAASDNVPFSVTPLDAAGNAKLASTLPARAGNETLDPKDPVAVLDVPAEPVELALGLGLGTTGGRYPPPPPPPPHATNTDDNKKADIAVRPTNLTSNP